MSGITALTADLPPSEIAPYTNGTAVSSFMVPEKQQTSVGSINEEDSKLESDPFSEQTAFRRDDGSLFLNIPANLWEKTGGINQITDRQRDSGIELDHVTVTADTVSQVDAQNNIIKDIEGKPNKYTLISMKQVGYKKGPLGEKERIELGGEHSVRLGAKVKSTTLPFDRENEIYIGVDAIRSVTRRLQEYEVGLNEIANGTTGSNEPAEVQRRNLAAAYHVSDLLASPSTNNQISSLSDDVLRERADKLPNMIRDLYRVN